MNVALRDVAEPGMKFSYEYDFGSTTELALKVVALREGATQAGDIALLARNDPPQVPCDRCGRETGKIAAQICTQCDYGWLCEDCAAGHECGQDMFLPVVNSPRVGVCGYTG